MALGACLHHHVLGQMFLGTFVSALVWTSGENVVPTGQREGGREVHRKPGYYQRYSSATRKPRLAPSPQSSSSFHSLQLQEAVITSPPHYDKAQTQRDGAPCPRSLSSQAGFEPRSVSIQSLGFPTSCGSSLLDTELKDLQRARSPLLEKCKQRTHTHNTACDFRGFPQSR